MDMNTTPEPNLKHRETVFSRPATSSQNRRRFPSRLRQRKFRDCMAISHLQQYPRGPQFSRYVRSPNSFI